MTAVTRIARLLAPQMTALGITPQNVQSHPAYLGIDGVALLRYAMDEHRQPVLGWHACSLHQDGNDWLCWDRYGAENARITYRQGSWLVA